MVFTNPITGMCWKMVKVAQFSDFCNRKSGEKRGFQAQIGSESVKIGSEMVKIRHITRICWNVLECARMCWNVVKVTSSVIFVREKVGKKSFSSSNRVRKSQNWVRNGQN